MDSQEKIKKCDGGKFLMGKYSDVTCYRMASWQVQNNFSWRATRDNTEAATGVPFILKKEIKIIFQKEKKSSRLLDKEIFSVYEILPLKSAVFPHGQRYFEENKMKKEY